MKWNCDSKREKAVSSVCELKLAGDRAVWLPYVPVSGMQIVFKTWEKKSSCWGRLRCERRHIPRAGRCGKPDRLWLRCLAWVQFSPRFPVRQGWAEVWRPPQGGSPRVGLPVRPAACGLKDGRRLPNSSPGDFWRPGGAAPRSACPQTLHCVQNQVPSPLAGVAYPTSQHVFNRVCPPLYCVHCGLFFSC